MTGPAAEFKFGSWSAPQVPLTIEYPLEVMDEIRAAAWDGLQQLVHGGLEVGGVLFGVRRDNSIRLLTWRPIPCEHADGPSLRLAPRDRLNLTRLLEAARNDPDLKGLQPIGWFLSHSRSDIFLSASDLEIYSGFFPEPWQVTLVVRPSKAGSARAGFFVREADGSLRSESSYQDFLVEPLHRPRSSREPDRRRLPRELQPPGVPSEPRSAAPAVVESARPEPAKSIEPPVFLIQKPHSPSRYRWLWAIPASLALIIAGLLVKEMFLPAYNQPFSFRAYDAGQTVQLEWDPNSDPVRSSTTAEVDIKDGAATPHFSLTADQLRVGKMTYVRQSADVELRMTVHPAGRPAIQEFARLVGSARTQAPVPANRQSGPPPAAPDTAQLRAERDQLAAEVRQLKEDLRKERARADKAQENFRILQNRIDVDAARGLGPDGKQKK